MPTVRTDIHLTPTDAPAIAREGTAGTVWVALAGDYGHAHVYPSGPAQADLLAAAFTDAARRMRAHTTPTPTPEASRA